MDTSAGRIDSPLATPPTRAAVVEAVRACHRKIVRDVRASLAKFISKGDYESAMAVKGEGVGDITYQIDAVADRAVEALARDIGKIAPCRILCEGLGEMIGGRGEPRLRVQVDPIDGTRNVMADLRSAWALTGIAVERGDEILTTQDLELCIQTEIPPSDRKHATELVATRGAGCAKRTYHLETWLPSRSSAWRAPRKLDLRSGYYTFLRYLPRERPAIARIEAEFFARARRELQLDTSCVYDDQWLCAAGQLYLVSTGRMRMFADLRAWLGAKAGVETIACHPYDLCSMGIATEAGSHVLGITKSGELEPLAAPLDLLTNVSFVAFANGAARAALEPVLVDALKSAGRDAARLMRSNAS